MHFSKDCPYAIDSTFSLVMHKSGPSAAPVDGRDSTLTFNTSCYGRDVSHLTPSDDPSLRAADSYHTRWLEQRINCETSTGQAADITADPGAPAREARPPEQLKIIRAAERIMQ
jgi:hypothetical protein